MTENQLETLKEQYDVINEAMREIKWIIEDIEARGGNSNV